MAADTIADPPAGAPARQRLHAPIATLDADALDPDEIAAALRFAAAARSANTRLAYAADWAHFVTWCAERGASPLPCPPGLMAGYLAALAASGLRASTIGRRAAGVAHVHRMNGHTPPTASEAVRAVLRGIRHSLGTAPSPKAPATHDVIARMIAACPTTSLIGLRDRAMIVLGFAGAFRRSELLALEVADLVEVPDGLRVAIRRSKTDQEGAGQGRSPSRAATACARWRRCRGGWPQRRSALGQCSARSARAAASARPRSGTTDSSVRSSAAPPPAAWIPPRSPGTHCAPGSSPVPPRAGRMRSRWPRCRGIARSTCCAAMSGAATCSRPMPALGFSDPASLGSSLLPSPAVARLPGLRGETSAVIQQRLCGSMSSR
jgi:site-specific recombinase XerC